ncbi:S8 family peptidase [Virgisporangium aliadipatigenens]|uniref:S8 family peptidase n=1 Tax=Virgisporangium aliadipatigenens TaxID=741659 RepID=UPI001EF2AC46|nr:S8 family peptidase [Virgisporangium aliadipatigenens]
MTLVTPGSGSAAPSSDGSSALYIVQLAGNPLATYNGGVGNIPATKPTAGGKLDTKAWNYNAYREHLRTSRQQALKDAGLASSTKPVRQYEVSFNGFAAELTVGQAEKLKKTPGVVNVYKDKTYSAQTVTTPDFLGMSGQNGVWQQQFNGQSNAGEGMIIGVIDSGFWPESPSFAALPEPRPDADTIANKWYGICDTGETDPITCNNKVIGARYFRVSQNFSVGEHRSPRDRNGHGTHTASTAAGVPADANVAGTSLGTAVGMAPAARLAIYKALWHNPATGSAGGTGTDLIGAIDAAVSDGVDVINYSIGDDDDTPSPIDIAFYHAALAGVFIAASAGNAGPGANTVDNADPWMTTVGAGTHPVRYSKSVTLGNGATYEGAGVGATVPSAGLVDAANSGVAGSTPANAGACVANTLDPAKVTGKIVLCARGVNARVDKSAEVKRAGGVGMVQYNPSPNNLVAEIHSVPSTHLGTTEGQAVKAYIASAGAGATAAIGPTEKKAQAAPGVTAFSSVGPVDYNKGDLLKPDILAPGVDIVAAYSPEANPARSNYNLLSGTSMASPHIAGIAALIKQANPTWTPSMVQSALMTTATQTDNQGQPIQRPDLGVAATPLEYGAGHVRPGAAFNPGLVYQSGPLEWIQYLCGTGIDLPLGEDSESACATTGSIDPSDLNYPSISVGDLRIKQKITRTVTNTTNQASVYFARVQAPPGVTVTVTPSTLTVLPRRSATYTIEITRTSAPLDQFTQGSLSWSDLRGHTVKSPIVVRPQSLDAPATVTGTGTSGSAQIKVGTYYSGQLKASAAGLVAPSIDTYKLSGTEQGFNVNAPATGPGVARKTINVPNTNRAVRFSTVNGDYPAGADIDLYVYLNGELVGVGGSGGPEETVTLGGGGTYDVFVVQYAKAPGVGTQDVKLYTHVLDSTPGSLSVSPATQNVTTGQQATVTASWSGLTPGVRYLGVVDFADATASRGQTLVDVRA